MDVAGSQPRTLVDGCPRCRLEAAVCRAVAARARVYYLAAATALGVAVLIVAALWGRPGAAVTALLAVSVAGVALATIVRYNLSQSLERLARRNGAQQVPHEH